MYTPILLIFTYINCFDMDRVYKKMIDKLITNVNNNTKLSNIRDENLIGEMIDALKIQSGITKKNKVLEIKDKIQDSKKEDKIENATNYQEKENYTNEEQIKTDIDDNKYKAKEICNNDNTKETVNEAENPDFTNENHIKRNHGSYTIYQPSEYIDKHDFNYIESSKHLTEQYQGISSDDRNCNNSSNDNKKNDYSNKNRKDHLFADSVNYKNKSMEKLLMSDKYVNYKNYANKLKTNNFTNHFKFNISSDKENDIIEADSHACNFSIGFGFGLAKKEKPRFHEFQPSDSELIRIERATAESFNEILRNLKKKHYGTSIDIKAIIVEDIQDMIAISRSMITSTNNNMEKRYFEIYENQKEALIESLKIVKEKIMKMFKDDIYVDTNKIDTNYFDQMIENEIENVKQQINFLFLTFGQNLNEVSEVNMTILTGALANLLTNLSDVNSNNQAFSTINILPLENFTTIIENKLSSMINEANGSIQKLKQNIMNLLVLNVGCEEEDIADIQQMASTVFTKLWDDISALIQYNYIVINKYLKNESKRSFGMVENVIIKRLLNIKEKMETLFDDVKKDQMNQFETAIENMHDEILAGMLSKISYE